MLVSRSGFTDGVREAAARDSRIMLVDPDGLSADA
jgi:hypothetical protein